MNVGSGREISIGDLARLICKLTGSKCKVAQDPARVRPEASEVERLLCDMKQIKALTGWTSSIGLEQGLERTIAWFKDNQRHYRPGEYLK